jgi:hypothetical protein
LTPGAERENENRTGFGKGPIVPKTSAARRAEQDEAFLAALGRAGNARLAARTLGVHRSTYTKRRARDPALAARWDSVLAGCHAALEASAGECPGPNCRSRTRTRGGELTIVRLPNGRYQARRAPPGRMTRAARQIFLEALSASANVRLAAATAGFSHSAFYYRKRVYPDFADEMKEAHSIGYERVQCALYQSFDLMAGPQYGETRDDWLERVGDCPLPPMSVDQAIQLIAMHRRTCREGWEHREARYRVASNDEVRRALEVALVCVGQRYAVEATRSWRPADEAPPPPAPPLHLVTGWSKATGRPKHNPNRALFGGWRITDWKRSRP